jgi:hypothetical protein
MQYKSDEKRFPTVSSPYASFWVSSMVIKGCVGLSKPKTDRISVIDFECIIALLILFVQNYFNALKFINTNR